MRTNNLLGLIPVSCSFQFGVTPISSLRLHQEEKPDIVILDWMLPELNGLEVLHRIRQGSVTPILMLTARSEEVDRVLGLEIGTDDYLTKPFSMRELIARIHTWGASSQ